MSLRMADFEKAMNAALHGPDNTHVKIDQHDFNVDRAKITRDGNIIKVVGDDGHNISHRLALRPDDQILYKFEKEGDTVRNLEIEIKHGGVLKLVHVIQELWEEYKKAKEEDEATGKSDEASDAEAFEKTKELLDGSWEGEARFMIANIGIRVK
jgi:hypothetical protein